MKLVSLGLQSQIFEPGNYRECSLVQKFQWLSGGGVYLIAGSPCALVHKERVEISALLGRSFKIVFVGNQCANVSLDSVGPSWGRVMSSDLAGEIQQIISAGFTGRNAFAFVAECVNVGKAVQFADGPQPPLHQHASPRNSEMKHFD